MYYRLQNENYDITENHQSYIWSAGSLIDAMTRDLDRWEIKHPSEYEEENFEEIKSLWNSNWEEHEMEDNFNHERCAEAGTSCFDNIESLINYFEENDLGTKGYHYLLLFDGEWITTGFDGEEIVKFEKEIKRIPFILLDDLKEIEE